MFDTCELTHEAEARKRRQAKKDNAKRATVSTSKVTVPIPDAEAPKAHALLAKKFNLRTYKFHSLGDYPQTICQFGTTDSYSTEPASNSIAFLICRC